MVSTGETPRRISGVRYENVKADTGEQMVAFTREERELATEIYRGYADAIGRSVVQWEQDGWKRGLPEVFVALYSHAFGVDVSVFTSECEARQCLRSLTRDQCVRDAKVRRAVARRFGWGKWTDALFATLSDDERDQLVDAWCEVAPGEALWVSRCILEREFARRALRAEVLANMRD